MPRHRKSHRRNKRGGSLLPLMPASISFAPPAPVPVAPAPQGGGGSYVESVVGDMQQQYGNTFNQGGPYGSVQGNALIGQQGQGIPHASIMPTAQQLAMAQNGGKKRHGGFLGPMLNQAAAPLAMLAMQQTFRRKRHGSASRLSRKSRRSRKYRR